VKPLLEEVPGSRLPGPQAPGLGQGAVGNSEIPATDHCPKEKALKMIVREARLRSGYYQAL
jgi:hypothetical protein